MTITAQPGPPLFSPSPFDQLPQRGPALQSATVCILYYFLCCLGSSWQCHQQTWAQGGAPLLPIHFEWGPLSSATRSSWRWIPRSCCSYSEMFDKKRKNLKSDVWPQNSVWSGFSFAQLLRMFPVLWHMTICSNSISFIFHDLCQVSCRCSYFKSC